MKKSNEAMRVPTSGPTVKDLVDTRIAEREAQLMSEISDEFETRLKRAEKTLRDREDSILEGFPQEEKEFIKESCRVSEMRRRLASQLSAKREAIISGLCNKWEKNPDSNYVAQAASLELLREDLHIFNSAAREMSGLDAVVPEINTPGFSINHSRALSDWVKSQLTIRFRGLERITASLGSREEARPNLEVNNRQLSLRSMNYSEEVASDEEPSAEIRQLHKILEMLRKVDFTRSLIDHQEQTDTKYLRVIAQFSSALFEKSQGTHSDTIDNLVPSKILPIVLQLNEALVHCVIEGIDLFCARNFPFDKRVQRLVEFESSRRARIGLKCVKCPLRTVG